MHCFKKVYSTLCVLLVTISHASGQEVYKRSAVLMGCDFELIVVEKSLEKAQEHLTAAVKEIQRIETLISSWDTASQTSKINRNAGFKPVVVDLELYQLIDRSISISRLVDGAFDISFAGLESLWKFDGSMTQLPTKDALKSLIENVNFDSIQLSPEDTSVYLPGAMRLGFGAIGKGYAADQAKNVLLSRGVTSGIVNASGDISAWGTQPDGSPWVIALEHPMRNGEVFATFPIEDGAVVTSGDYKKFVRISGKRFAHILDPRTGMPANGLISVSVLAPTAEFADALATSVFVLGKEVGIDRIHQLPGVECLVIDTAGAIFSSHNIQIDTYK